MKTTLNKLQSISLQSAEAAWQERVGCSERAASVKVAKLVVVPPITDEELCIDHTQPLGELLEAVEEAVGAEE